MYRSILVPAALAAGLFAGAAQAQQGIVLGTLSCTGGEGVGLILGSQKSYDCRFAPVGSGAPDNYRATVTKVGLDIGVTGTTTMVWTVLSAAPNPGGRALAGTYAGAVADASLGIGAGAKVLLGGFKKSITLQPLSIQGQTGVNLAVGVGELDLQ